MQIYIVYKTLEAGVYYIHVHIHLIGEWQQATFVVMYTSNCLNHMYTLQKYQTARRGWYIGFRNDGRWVDKRVYINID